MCHILNNIFFFSSLFPDVVNCMQTDNLELKKLVYLYLMNYAKSQPDMAIMAVNTFVKVGWFRNLCRRLTYIFVQDIYLTLDDSSQAVAGKAAAV